MGAWSGDSFGNDNALDWTYDLPEGGLRLLRATLLEASSCYLTLDLEDGVATNALAAAEVVAAAAGRPVANNTYNEEALGWAAAHPEAADLVPLAHRAVTRVLSDKSKLREAWTEDGVVRREWADHVDDLLGRLSPG